MRLWVVCTSIHFRIFLRMTPNLQLFNVWWFFFIREQRIWHPLMKQDTICIFPKIKVWIQFLPPKMHVKRVIYQCGKWKQSLQANLQLPSPSNFGWQQSNNDNTMWEPKWINLQEASKEARQFYKCACKSECTRCKCKTASLKCTMFCTCKCQDRVSYAWKLDTSRQQQL